MPVVASEEQTGCFSPSLRVVEGDRAGRINRQLGRLLVLVHAA